MAKQRIEIPADPDADPVGDQSPEPEASAAPRKTGMASGAGTIDSPMDYDEAMGKYERGELKRSTFTTRGWLAVAKPIPNQARV